MAGRRGVVVRLCNGYSTVHAAEGEEGEIVEMHLRVWELRLHIRDYIGCWCDTLRHLPTTSTPFEGVWVQCDLCSRWCHGECAGLDRTAAEEAESYTCLPCARGGAPPPAVSAPTHTGLSPDAPPRATEGGLAAGKNKTPAARENKTPAAGKNKALPSRGGENKPLPSGKTKTLAAGKDKISVAGKNKTPTAGEDETAVADEEKPSVLNLERLRRPPSSRGEGSLSSIRGGGSPSSVQGRGSPSSLRGGGSPSPPQGEPSGNRTAAVAKRSVQAGATPAQAPVLPGQGTVLVPPGGAPALAPPGEGVADALPVVSLAGGAGRSSGSRGRGGRAISGRGGGRAISGPGGSGGACSGGRDYSWPGEACGPQIAPGRPAVSRKRCAAAAGGDDRQRLGPASEGSPLHGPDSPQLPLPTVEPPMPPRLGYSEGAIPSPARAPRAAAAAACASSSLCRWVLEHGNAELFYAVLLFLDDAWALRAASCVCAGWRRLLDRAAADGAAAIWSASTLTAPRGRGWASLRATRPGDKVHLLPGSFPSPLELSHPLELTGAPGHATHLTGPLILRGSSTAGRVGLLRNLHLSHFYNPAVTLFGGAWRFEGCTIDSSRRTARAVAGVVLRGGASLELVGCTIISASAAVNLCEAGCALTATSSCFRNVKSGVLCERGGSVTVFGCRFDALSGSDVGLRLSADTTGDVRASSASRLGGLWGRMAPPPGVVFVEAAEEDVDVVAVEAGMGGMLLHAAGAPQAA